MDKIAVAFKLFLFLYIACRTHAQKVDNRAKTLTVSISSACNSEQAAAVVLGFTQVSWDNLSGQLPTDFFLFWAEMTENQKAAAGLLGYTQTTWDNDSGSEPRPASAFKSWSELTVCNDGEDL